MCFLDSHVGITTLLCISVPKDCFYAGKQDTDPRAFHLVLHCLSEYQFKMFQYKNCEGLSIKGIDLSFIA